MSVAIISSAAAALMTVATVVVASSPEAQAVLSPLTDRGSEYATTAVGMLISFPILAVLAVVAGAKD